MEEQPTAPGWYNDPDGVHSHQAYWDGVRWTGSMRSTPLLSKTKSSSFFWALGGFAISFVVGFSIGRERYAVLISAMAVLGVVLVGLGWKVGIGGGMEGGGRQALWMTGGASAGVWLGTVIFGSGYDLGLAAAILAIWASPAYCLAAFVVGFVPGSLFKAVSAVRKRWAGRRPPNRD